MNKQLSIFLKYIYIINLKVKFFVIFLEKVIIVIEITVFGVCENVNINDNFSNDIYNKKKIIFFILI